MCVALLFMDLRNILYFWRITDQIIHHFSAIVHPKARLNRIQTISFIQKLLELFRHHPFHYLAPKCDVRHRPITGSRMAFFRSGLMIALFTEAW